MQLQQFDKKAMTSVEKEMRAKGEEIVESEDSLKLNEQNDLTDWIKVTLGQKAAKVKTTSKLESHPCVVTVEEMAAARHFIKTQGTNFTEDQKHSSYKCTVGKYIASLALYNIRTPPNYIVLRVRSHCIV